jgi:hypothetical protein
MKLSSESKKTEGLKRSTGKRFKRRRVKQLKRRRGIGIKEKEGKMDYREGLGKRLERSLS